MNSFTRASPLVGVGVLAVVAAAPAAHVVLVDRDGGREHVHQVVLLLAAVQRRARLLQAGHEPALAGAEVGAQEGELGPRGEDGLRGAPGLGQPPRTGVLVQLAEVVHLQTRDI